jgi:formylglycine-generating enzyme required for sulfatase activity
MIKKVILLMSFSGWAANAQVITQNFGTGENLFSIEFVEIGNPNNAADTSGSPNPVGAVSYIYNLGKYEVSRDMINKANLAGALGVTLYDMTNYGGNGANKPATGISWSEAATYVNWLNTSTGNTAAYKFDGSGNFVLWSPSDSGYNANNLFRNSLAKYFLPSVNEWYKGAYGSPSGTWYNYATGTDSVPTAVVSGTSPYTAVYGGQVGPADINDAGGLSSYGTMAQGGNVFEWTDSAYDGVNDAIDEFRELRGGAWDGNSNLVATDRDVNNMQNTATRLRGFRIAMVPEPSALSLLAVGLGGLAMMRWRRS